MKRFVKAAVISATLAAAAAIPTSCTWMEDYFKTGTDKTDEPEIPLDEVLSIEELPVHSSATPSGSAATSSAACRPTASSTSAARAASWPTP